MTRRWPSVRAEKARAQLDGFDEMVLRDGHVLHVPLHLMDGSVNPELTDLQKAVALDTAKRSRGYTVADAQRFGLKDASAMHRPGFRFAADPLARDEAIIALANYDADVESAWKGNPPVGEGSKGPVDPMDKAARVIAVRSMAGVDGKSTWAEGLYASPRRSPATTLRKSLTSAPI